MATPNRELIIDDLFSTLDSISTANGYKTEVDTVERVAKDWATAQDDGDYPWLGMKPGAERYEHQPFGQLRVTLPVTIVGHVHGSDDADRTSKISALIDDVIAAVSADSTRGGNAMMTTIVDDEADDGDPDTITREGFTSSFVQNIEIVYFRDTGST